MKNKIAIVVQLGTFIGDDKAILTHTAELPDECIERIKPIINEYSKEILKNKKEKKICSKCGNDYGYLINKL